MALVALVGLCTGMVSLMDVSAQPLWTYAIGTPATTGDPQPIFSIQSPATC